MLYHVLGVVNFLVFLLTWYGLAQQVVEIYTRKQRGVEATENLSVNQFGSSFLAFYSNFFFGIAAEVFNYYLVFTRGVALVLLLIVLGYLCVDRRSKLVRSVFVLSLLAFLAGCVAIFFRPFSAWVPDSSAVIMVLVTIILVQGTVSQWLIIRRTRKVGALSSSLIASTLIKDISTLAFALTMPISDAWPLLLLNGSSVIFRGLLFLEMRRVGNRPKPEAP